MFRQRALAWAAVLALIATVRSHPYQLGFRRPSPRRWPRRLHRRGGQPTDLAIAALQCDEAPATEALTSFFSTGAAPTTCAPAVGVKIAVTENGDPVSGSPFTTDTRRHRRGPGRSGFRGRGQRRPEVAAGWLRTPEPRGERRPLCQPGAAGLGRGRRRRALRQRARHRAAELTQDALRRRCG